jgi:hypothetical protein
VIKPSIISLYFIAYLNSSVFTGSIGKFVELSAYIVFVGLVSSEFISLCPNMIREQVVEIEGLLNSFSKECLPDAFQVNNTFYQGQN